MEGWFSERASWIRKDASVIPLLANIVGAKRDEALVMNSLTMNLHIMFAHFYQPVLGKKYKVVMEKGAFPSDTVDFFQGRSLIGTESYFEPDCSQIPNYAARTGP